VNDPLAALARHFASIPLTTAMGLVVTGREDDALVLAAPLAPNINDKGCAFGGSLASLMTLAGWGWVELATQARGIAADIYVRDSALRYLAPVWSDFRALARPAADADVEDFLHTLATDGKARLRMHCEAAAADSEPPGQAAATMDAVFVALTRTG